jgi:hypothetical protein
MSLPVTESGGLTRVEVRRVWQHPGEDAIVHLLLMAGKYGSRHIKLRRETNPAMYDFVVEHSAITMERGPDLDPATTDV